jgi:hypothetical protein
VFTEVDVLGAFVPIAVVQLAACVVIFAVVDALLSRMRFYRLFWHAPLARFGLFVLFFCAIGFALVTH